MGGAGWRFAIDVGGTFTDVLAHDPAGREHVLKCPSDGRVRGVAGAGSRADAIVAEGALGRRADLLVGYRVGLVGAASASGDSEMPRVLAGDPATGRLRLDRPLPGRIPPGVGIELRSGEPAPVLAIRWLLGLRLDETIGPVDVRLGSTRGTNALLERKGAETVLAITEGFGDLLRIGYQNRPELFALAIRKPEPVAAHVVEIPERMAPDGRVLRAPDPDRIERCLRAARDGGARAAAICLMHACTNDAHERLVAGIARRVGFEAISVSSRTAPAPRIVPRAETTVVDAYLSPVIRSYVRALRCRLPEARLRLMTSAGGLAAAESFAAKDGVLSGPAGGVVGCARVAREAGLDRVIGFDMGGTSTDVCRYEGRFEYEYEAEKAGVRIVAPMLAVETVAAGGGSVCRFDGQKLAVGPRSAGADPGPACYGRGGPLALTDMNLHLGRILPDRFPFPLDRDAVERRLRALADEVARATGRRLDPLELAEGFVAIANANMASAIRRISVARGHDVRRYTLVGFGGAGGQHACGVARHLGVRRALVGPHAGVLSAVGMAAANVTRHAERPLLRPYDDALRAELPAIFGAMEEPLRREILREGIGEAHIAPARRSLDLRYRGQSATLTVEADPAGDFREPFEEAHVRRFGYRHADRAIETVAARVEVAGRMEVPERPAAERRPHEPVPREHRDAIFEGRPIATPVFLREDLAPGATFDGPAIVIDSFGIIVVEPLWRASVTERLDIVLEDRASGTRGIPACRGSGDRKEVDPIRLELFHNRFASIAAEMGETLRRTALSTNVKERLDFSCAVFDAEGRLAANAPHIPVHLGGMGACVRRILRRFGGLDPGDVVVTNDPYEGGSHLPDVTVVTPVFADGEDAPRFFVANRAHHAEIGGRRPGSMGADARTLAEEGVRIRPIKLIERGTERFDLLRRILTRGPHPSRRPEENLADLAAQVAANRRGAALLEELARACGADVVAAYMGHIREAAARKVRAALRAFPAGRHERVERLDDGTPIAVRIEIGGDGAVFDFTGSGAVHPANLNANPTIVASAVLYCLRCLIDEEIPLNEGMLAPVRLVIPRGILHPPAAADPARCPAVGGGNVETSQRIVDAILGALGAAAAGQGTMNNLLIGNERFGYYETVAGGAGAGPGFRGADGVHTHMTNTRATDPEVLESRYPLRLVRFAIRRGSGGAGRFRGGDGLVREIAFSEPVEISILSQRRTTRPYGLAGGAPGASGRNRLIRSKGEVVELGPIAHLEAGPGDRLLIETPGGGGYGA